MKLKLLYFKDLVTGQEWTHDPNDWILNYCNFNSEIHPSQLRVGQSTTGKTTEGHDVLIEAKKVEKGEK